MTTYKALLEFVSWNFQVTRSGELRLLECREHGEIGAWEGRLNDGDLTFMRAIGQHMDEVEHDQIPA